MTTLTPHLPDLAWPRHPVLRGLGYVLATAVFYLLLPQVSPQVPGWQVSLLTMGMPLGLTAGLAARAEPVYLPAICLTAAATLGWQFAGLGISPWSVLAVAGIVAAEIAVVASLLRGVATRVPASVRAVLRLVAVSVLVAVPAALLAVTALSAGSVRTYSGDSSAVLTWAVDDLFGLVCFAPLVLVARRPTPIPARRALELASALVASVLIAVHIFVRVTPGSPGLLGWPYLVLIGPLWVAARFGMRAVTPVVAFLAWFGALQTLNGRGMFAMAVMTPANQLMAIELFCTVITVTVLLVAAQRDERSATLADLSESRELLRVVLDSSRDATMRLDRDLRVEYVNRRSAEVFGIPLQEWPGRTFAEMGYPPDLVANLNAHHRQVLETGEPVTYEYEVDSLEGHRWYETSVSPEFGADGAVVHLVTTSRDVTGRKADEAELQRLATHDSLTGLANRAVLLAETGRAIAAGQRSGRSTAVLMLDLDRFKYVNDSLGHQAGDALLVAAAERIQSTARGSDLAARLGGDEFTVVLRDLTDATEAVRAAWRLVAAFRGPFTIGGAELYATASIGVAVATAGHDANDVLREADTALYVAKDEGRDRVAVFNEDLRAAVTTRLAIENDLRRAVERDELLVWYQPEVDLAAGAVIAVEALLRWTHPDGSIWTADRFIEVAEDTGLILEIGDWVMRTAAAQAAAWAAAHPTTPITVGVNVSATQLAEAGLLDAIDEALAASGLDPALMRVEITETALLRETATAQENISGIHDRGIAIALDDFGTGYGSLTYLRRYPIDIVKIDRSFLTDASAADHDHRIIAGIIALAGALGVSVTAEGVEQPEQAAHLGQLGCSAAQGWLYSKAVPAEEMGALLDTTYPFMSGAATN